MNLQFPSGKLSYIAVIEDFISRDLCSELVNFCEHNFELLFQPGKMMGGFNPNHKNSFDWSLLYDDEKLTGQQSELIQKIDTEICNSLTQALILYAENFPTMESWKEVTDTGYRVQKYLQNQGFYKPHIDGAAWYRDKTEKRSLAAVIYLNDVKEGGGTKFEYHDLTVAAVAGQIALFPTSWTHPHGGEIPVSEDKWIISSFVC